MTETGEAYQVLRGDRPSAVLILCEHASERLPHPWRWPEKDRWLLGTHWASDLGAEDLARDLAKGLGATAVLARFSRLLVDANRPQGDPTLFRTRADGEPVHLNVGMRPDDARRRLSEYHRAYHAAVDREAQASQAPLLLAVHTFTPVYEGQRRTVEAGVLFDHEEELAAELRDEFAREGFVVGMNVPYSGKEGLIYSADRHARVHGRAALEIELRQDLAQLPEHRRRAVAAVRSLVSRRWG